MARFKALERNYKSEDMSFSFQRFLLVTFNLLIMFDKVFPWWYVGPSVGSSP